MFTVKAVTSVITDEPCLLCLEDLTPEKNKSPKKRYRYNSKFRALRKIREDFMEEAAFFSGILSTGEI